MSRTTRGNDCEYDELERAKKITDELGGETRYEYCSVGNRTKVSTKIFASPEKWLVTRYTYTNRNQLNTVIADDGGLEIITSYVYDIVGRMTDVTQDFDGENATRTHYVYDNLGRRTSVTAAAPSPLAGEGYRVRGIPPAAAPPSPLTPAPLPRGERGGGLRDGRRAHVQLDLRPRRAAAEYDRPEHADDRVQLRHPRPDEGRQLCRRFVRAKHVRHRLARGLFDRRRRQNYELLL